MQCSPCLYKTISLYASQATDASLIWGVPFKHWWHLTYHMSMGSAIYGSKMQTLKHTTLLYFTENKYTNYSSQHYKPWSHR